jgi:hypothetical protein
MRQSVRAEIREDRLVDLNVAWIVSRSQIWNLEKKSKVIDLTVTDKIGNLNAILQSTQEAPAKEDVTQGLNRRINTTAFCAWIDDSRMEGLGLEGHVVWIQHASRVDKRK